MTDLDDDSSDRATIRIGPIGPIPVRADDEPGMAASRKGLFVYRAVRLDVRLHSVEKDLQR
jgi:hypothetical protein